jgi:hypothetical protein
MLSVNYIDKFYPTRKKCVALGHARWAGRTRKKRKKCLSRGVKNDPEEATTTQSFPKERSKQNFMMMKYKIVIT